ncbi:hypothetical protein J2Z60_000228 [Lactobacillus colini]|uniref:ABC transporter permease n=1 Tax=Lactobacillus colini TaxID=1819254 RepID=A0ABS4MBK6_9LACO|nr:ABC transporter permease [Lactobacillus colini]MBP2057066.1 hypothetical protein [Lactobacillus colini]
MTRFIDLFDELFKTKRRGVHLIILLQVVAAIVLTIWALIAKFEIGEPMLYFWEMMAAASVFADLAYVVVSTWQNERIYKYQTWRLIPISPTKTYVANILSGFVAGVYLVIIQIGLMLISLLPLLTSKDIRIQIGDAAHHLKKVNTHVLWSKFWALFSWQDLLSFLIAFFLFAILVYSAVSTIDLSSKTIADFLPEKFNKIARFCIILVLIIVGDILLSNLSDAVNGFLNSLMDPNHASTYGIWISNGTFCIIDIILSGVNIWLLRAYHEGK